MSLREHWDTQAYIVVRRLIEPSEAAAMLDLCEDILQQWRAGKGPERNESAGVRQAVSMRHLNHPLYFKERPEDFPMMMDLIADERVLSVVREIVGAEPMFFCTSMFFNPLENSHDGNWHRDSQFVTKSEEEEKQFLWNEHRHTGVQFQIALVPSEDSEVVPGSHLRWDTSEEYHIRKSDGGQHCRSNDMPGAVRVRLEPGDAIAFNPLALHRGRYHTDKLRRTFMPTYTSPVGELKPDYSNYFTYQPWFLEPDYLAPLKPQTKAFFQRFVDTYRGSWQKEK
jgi:ectoine hydroxylase-related dioxygenase (phytanoyl-CoA dioxygenase family)